ncbi:MAG TPA: C25 family cysteine peptidase, partial [Candidatus Kapabacteria bacterium]
MLFLRRIIWLALFVLLCAEAVSHAMQVQRPVQKLTQQQAARLITKPATIAKSKPAQRHTPVSTHIHPKRNTKRHSISTTIIRGRSSRNSIIRSHRTAMEEKSGSVTLDVEIGKPIVSSAGVSVANAPAGMKFSRLAWSGLTRVPAGVLLRKAEQGTEYPLMQFTFAIPANATGITPILKPTRSAALGPLNFVPILSKGNGARTYAVNAAIPAISVSKPKTFRSLRMVTVTLPLVTTGSAGYSAFEAFTVGIDFNLTGTQTPPSSPDPLYATLNAHLVVNAPDLPAFAVPMRTKRPAAPARTKSLLTTSIQQSSDSVTSWIDTNAAYVRLAVTRNGLYRVNASDLELSGFSLQNSSWTARNLRCFNRGVEVPLWIDSDASGHITGIEFYGEHLHGFPLPQIQQIYTLSYDFEPNGSHSEYYNVATDTNVYWLTTSGGDTLPLRYIGIAPSPQNAPNIVSGTVLLHHEKDLVYYPGDPVQDQTYTWNATEWVSGERFIWKLMHGTQDNDANPDNTHFADTFFVSKLPADPAGKVATVSFLFRGATMKGTGVHTVRAAMNGVQSFQPNFSGYDYDTLVMTVPLSNLRVGANIVTADAGSVGDNTDQFYLDYYLVSFEEALTPSIDTAIAKGQWLFTLTPGSQKFQLPLSDNSAHLYNRSDRTRILGNFIDSTKTLNPQYAAATTASLLKCDNIQAWNTKAAVVGTWEILNPQNQVDYLIITHPSFLRAAQMLATSRANEGMKTKVVTTDEVFNAFDFGSNEAEAIRRYVTYACNRYAGTPVSFVTLLGNASWDPKHNQAGDFERSFIPTYGNPVSDYYFTIPAQDSSLDSPPLTLISRSPVSTEA